MGTFTDLKDINAFITGHAAVGQTSATAGGSGDDTAASGEWVKREYYYSGSVLIPYTTSLADGETLAFTVTFEHADDASGSNAESYDPAYCDSGVENEVVHSGAVSDESGVCQVPVNLQAAKNYVRVNVTPVMSASSTDTASFSAVLVLGGDRNNIYGQPKEQGAVSVAG